MDKTKYIDTDYLHVSTVMRVKETRLLGMDEFNKLLSARSYEETIKQLSDFGYDVPAESERSIEFEGLLSDQFKNICSEIIRLSNETDKNRSLLEFFSIQYDFMNLKALIKSELLSTSPEKMLFDTGNISVNDLTDAFRSRKKDVMGDHLYLAMEKAFEAYSKDQDPQMIDLICDKEYFAYMSEKAKKTGFDFLVEYALLKIDIINLISFVRIKKMNKDFDFYKKFIYYPATIGLEKYETIKDGELKDIPPILEKTSLSDYSHILEQKDPSISKLEQISDEIICRYIKKLRKVPFGAEIVASYVLSKEMELKNVRIVLAGKLSGLPSDLIRERLRVYYV